MHHCSLLQDSADSPEGATSNNSLRQICKQTDGWFQNDAGGSHGANSGNSPAANGKRESPGNSAPMSRTNSGLSSVSAVKGNRGPPGHSAVPMSRTNSGLSNAANGKRESPGISAVPMSRTNSSLSNASVATGKRGNQHGLVPDLADGWFQNQAGGAHETETTEEVHEREIAAARWERGVTAFANSVLSV